MNNAVRRQIAFQERLMREQTQMNADRKPAKRGGLNFGEEEIFNEDPLVKRRYSSFKDLRGVSNQIITYVFPNNKERKRGQWGWIEAPKEYDPSESEEGLIALLPSLTDEQKERIKKDIKYNESVKPNYARGTTRYSLPAYQDYFVPPSRTVAAPTPAPSSSSSFNEDPTNPTGGRRRKSTKKTRRRKSKRRGTRRH